jgi:hypothetical protein|tara:strand:+ start:208 stop:495 length:288 start_codon:yes stop_codon:yes gene_type:complete
VISLLLAGLIAAPSHNAKKPLTNRQVRVQAYQIVQHLKKQDPRILRSVMYYMKWVPKLEYTRQNCKKNNKSDLEKINDWEVDMLLDMSGIPRKKR